MSTSKTYQQSLADADSETRPPMLERVPKLQTAEDLQGDAIIRAKDMWKRVERLMRGIIQNKVDRETRFINEFDQFVAEPGEALVSVYNHFAQLMNDLERNDMHFQIVTINTKEEIVLGIECSKMRPKMFEGLLRTSVFQETLQLFNAPLTVEKDIKLGHADASRKEEIGRTAVQQMHNGQKFYMPIILLIWGQAYDSAVYNTIDEDNLIVDIIFELPKGNFNSGQ
ncbi:hypothetical protein Tco_0998140 [Tanacetum coccineum]